MTRKSQVSLLEKLDRLPPMFVRLLAKDKGKLMTDPELMRRTGWRKHHLRSVYQSLSWAKVRVGDVDIFLRACGFSWSSQRRQRWLLERAWRNGMDGIQSMRHLKVNSGWRGNQRKTHLERIRKLLTNEHRTNPPRVGPGPKELAGPTHPKPARPVDPVH